MSFLNIMKSIVLRKKTPDDSTLDARKTTMGALGRLSEVPGFRGF